MFLFPYHQWKGSGFKKGVCLWCPMPWASLWGHLWLGHLDVRGLGSLLWCCPLLSDSMGSWSGCLHQSKFTDKMFQAAAMVAVLLILLSFLHCIGQVHYELLHHTLNPIGVITLGTFFFISTILSQVCYPHCGVLTGWLLFNFWKGKKLIALGLFLFSAVWLCHGSIASSSQPPSLSGDNWNMSFHWCWLSVRHPLL